MKKILVNLLSIFLFIILLLSLSACNYSEPENVQRNIDVNILSCSDATQQDFDKHNCALTGDEVEFTVDNYRLMKFDCEFANNNDYAINVQGVKRILNDKFYFLSECVDIEPTYPFGAKETFNLDVYIYVDKELTDEQNIIDELNNADIIFDIIRCNDNVSDFALSQVSAVYEYYGEDAYDVYYDQDKQKVISYSVKLVNNSDYTLSEVRIYDKVNDCYVSFNESESLSIESRHELSSSKSFMVVDINATDEEIFAKILETEKTVSFIVESNRYSIDVVDIQ